MVLLKKQENISYQDHEKYFFEKHLPVVLAIPGLRGYKVNLRHPDDQTAPYDGISEFWFDDQAAFDAAMASEQTKATLADAVADVCDVRAGARAPARARCGRRAAIRGSSAVGVDRRRVPRRSVRHTRRHL